MKLALFDASGFPLAFYAPEINGDAIPADAVEITDEQWLDFLAHQGERRWADDAVVDFAPPVGPAFVPQAVSRFQARRALKDAGLFASVESAINASASDFLVDAWNEAAEFRRASPLIAGIAAALGLSSDQLDDLFRDAALIIA